jgi:uncharacterized protein YkwD
VRETREGGADICRLLALCNAARDALGIAPLHWSPLLAVTAHQHAQAMALQGYFDHVDRQLRGVGERLQANGYRFSRAGENISAGLNDIEAVFDWWMQSEGHRALILEPGFEETGFGHHYIAADALNMHHYWVQVFGARLPD